jgi:membrane protein
MIILLGVVSGVRRPWRDLSRGALLGGVGFTLLKLSAAFVLPRLTANPLFASFAVVVGLLVWINLIARLTLIAAAWAANDIDAIEHAAPSQVQAPGAGANAARDGSLPTFGARSTDRAAVGAGAVLGATTMAATAVLVRGSQCMIRRVRG